MTSLVYSPTEESSNFGKLCRLLLDIGTDVLRDKFDSVVRPEELVNLLVKQKSKLKKKLSGYQTKKLYPDEGIPLSSSFDISLLYLLFRETCDLAPPQNGWGKKPDSCDCTDSANIERLRQARNDIYGHAQCALIKTETFESVWQELSSALVCLGGEKYRNSIETLHDAPLSPTQTRQRKEQLMEWCLMEKRLENTVDKLFDIVENLPGEDTRKAQLMRILETRGREDRLFVETRAYQRIEHEVFQNGAVLITGDPGEGKTACAWHVILRCILKGYNLVVVDSAQDWRDQFHPSKRQVFLIDDCFGKSRGVPEKVEEWQGRYEHLRGGINRECTLFVATVRRLIYRDLKEMVHRLDIFGRAIDISSPEFTLTPFERLQIFNSYMSDTMQEYRLVGDTLLDTIACGKTPRFPLSCRLYASDKSLQQTGKQFFQNPVLQLKQELWHLSKNDKLTFSVLILLLLGDGELPFNIFDATSPKPPVGFVKLAQYLCCSSVRQKPWIMEQLHIMQESFKVPIDTRLGDIEQAISKLKGIYVVSAEESFKFVHQSILETVGIILGKDDLLFVLRYCSAHFIQQHVRIQSFYEEEDEDTILFIHENRYRLLAERLTTDIINGHIDEVFQNPSVTDILFSACWCSYISCLDRRTRLLFFRSIDRRGYSLMYWAARSGNINLFKYFLQYQSPTPDCIHGACHSGHMEMISLLMSKGIDPNYVDIGGFTPLMIACHTGNCKTVKLLIENGADPNIEQEDVGTALHFACWNEDTQLVKTLLENGAKANVVTEAGWPCLYFSGNGENYDVMQMLLKGGKGIHLTSNTGWSPLHLASGRENIEIVRLLLESGANVNLTTTRGWSPLFCASRRQRHNVAALLYQSGADLSLSDYFGVSCLHRLCLDGSCIVAKVLSESRGIDVNIKSKAGYTPLHCASEFGHMDLVKALLQHGADANITGLDGKRPIDIARKKGRDNIVKFFEAKHNKIDKAVE